MTLVLAEFEVASQTGNERLVLEKLAGAIAGLDLEPPQLERLKTAVAEATMNAIEHGNRNRAELPVGIRVVAANGRLTVQITDHGGGREIPEAEVPDLEAKLAGAQTPRGWGLFLIQNMVDELNTSSDDQYHTMELVLHLKGDRHGNQPV
jgi:anti-sigma regulatory factor (Ser/Thr protein kinase)